MSQQKITINANTQDFLDIVEIKENTVIMRDGSLRSVLLVSSINFALKSEDEQNAIISSYISFLNNIDFPLQIVIQSRELNIDSYIAKLGQKEKEQTNELLKTQIGEYIRYIGELILLGKIMSKHFYVIVPYNAVSDKQRGFFSSLTDAFRPTFLLKMRDNIFFERRQRLSLRAGEIIGGLSSMGLNAVELDTQSLIELFYNTYNPTTSSNEKMGDIKNLRIEN